MPAGITTEGNKGNEGGTWMKPSLSSVRVLGLMAVEAAEEGTIPACVGDDFPAKGKAYRDLTDE
jgi:hypothetical protein